MPEEPICVYTVLLDDYEALNEQPLAKASSVPFICLTDSPTLRSDSWECRAVELPLPMDAPRSQRDFKIRPHRYLPEFNGSIYIDNSVVLDRPADELWAMHDEGHGFTLARHSGRDTVLDEFVAVMRLGLDDGSRVAEQLDHLLLMQPAVLAERPWWTGMLLRHHHRKDLVDLAELWAVNVQRYSRRDQLSINAVFARHGFAPGALSIDNRHSPFHHWPVRVAARKRPTAPAAPAAALPQLVRQRVLEEREAAVARIEKSIAWQSERALRALGRTVRLQGERAARRVPAVLMRQIQDMPVLGPHVLRARLVGRYRRVHGVAPRLDPPVTFNEHMLARILHDRDPRLKVICDKLAVREFIRERVGDGFTVPLLGVWNDPGAIDWARLPARFALKPNHASGPIALVGAGAERDVGVLSTRAADWLAIDYYDVSFEWGYRGVPRRLLAEPLLEAPTGGPPLEAYVYTFGGKVAVIRMMEGGKFGSARRDRWFAADGTQLDVRLNIKPGTIDPHPTLIHDVVGIAEKLAAGFVHLRVDMMATSAGLFVNELSAYAHAANAQWKPQSWDEHLGRLWTKAALGEPAILGPNAVAAGAASG